MAVKKRPVVIDDPEMLAELGCVPMTDEAISKMSLNPYDQLFICRLLSTRDESVKEELAEIVIAQNKKMFSILDAQTEIIKEIARDIVDIKDRLKKIEDKQHYDELKLTSIDERLKAKKDRIEVLEKQMQVLNPDLIKQFVDEMIEFKPTLDELLKYASPWATFGRMFLAGLVGIFAILGLLKWVFHLI